jgi:hypothetical protein
MLVKSSLYSPGNVETELANADGHPVHAKVTQPKDTAAVGDDRDTSFLLTWPALQDLGNASLVLDGDEL